MKKKSVRLPAEVLPRNQLPETKRLVQYDWTIFCAPVDAGSSPILLFIKRAQSGRDIWQLHPDSNITKARSSISSLWIIHPKQNPAYIRGEVRWWAESKKTFTVFSLSRNVPWGIRWRSFVLNFFSTSSGINALKGCLHVSEVLRRMAPNPRLLLYSNSKFWRQDVVASDYFWYSLSC